MAEDKESTKEKKQVKKKVNKKAPATSQKTEEPISETINLSTAVNTVSSSEGGNKTMALTSIAIILSVIAISISLILLFTSEKGQKATKNELSDKLNSVLERVDAVENKLVEADQEGKTERTGRGLLELKKAILSFQEARTLIKDDDLINKILKIENEMKSLIVLPDPKDVGTEPGIDIETKTEETDVEATVNETTETTSQATESEVVQENEVDTTPTMEVEIRAEEGMNEIEESGNAVNEENPRP